MGQFDAKNVLVTGGSSGIGLASAQRFVNEGARVFVTGRRQEQLDKALAELGSKAVAIQGDISLAEDRDRIFETITREAGSLDVVFANAGGGTLATLEQLTVESFDHTFGNNVRGTVFTVQGALPLLRDGGAIVVTGSSSASRGNVGFGTYSASKAAIRQYGRVWAAELAPRGIRVNTVTPGPTDTPGLRGGVAEDPETAQAVLDLMAKTVPLGYVADPREVANVVSFLASSEASFMTGSEVFVDGGEVQVFA